MERQQKALVEWSIVFVWDTEKIGIGILKPLTNCWINAFGSWKISIWTDTTKSFHMKMRGRANIGDVVVEVEVAVQGDAKEFDVISKVVDRCP